MTLLTPAVVINFCVVRWTCLIFIGFPVFLLKVCVFDMNIGL